MFRPLGKVAFLMNVLVTGGTGFLGSAIVRMLIGKGHTAISFSRGAYPHLRATGVDLQRGDLTDIKALRQAASGCDAVIHTAAKAGVWGPVEDYERTNVLGTRNVIQVCQELKIRRLVYTSSPSVVFTGGDEDGIDESTPYAQRFLAEYPRTKALAEQAVLAANDKELATVALRPHLIWGPGDPYLVPRVLSRARDGKLALIGNGSNFVDSTYVDNAALAHLMALEKLAPEAACASKAYFISNGEPLPMETLLNHILAAADLPPITRHISPKLAYAAGAILEMVHGRLWPQHEPIMTRFVARQLSTSHWFQLDRARQDLGYQPLISLEEGFQHLRDSLAVASGT
jgi:nucleoside-diphosphate-sugar epimerase